MNRLNLLAAAVIVVGASLLGDAPAAHATYLDPWREPAGPITYCCNTGRATRCCFSTGCATSDGLCLKVG
jgi:hypothetical protein